MIERRLTELVQSIAAAFGARGDAALRARLSGDDQPRPRGDVRRRRRRVAGRRRQRRAQPRSVDGRRGLLVHAAGEARARSRGWGRAAPKAAASCTTARYDFNDAVIPLGAGYLAALAEAAMPLAGADARDATMPASTPRFRRFAATYAEARDRFLAAARARGLAVDSHVHPVARGAAGEDAGDRRRAAGRRDAAGAAGADVRHARRRGLLRLRAARSACCTTTRSSRARERAGVARACSCTRSIRTASRTCAGPTRTTSTSTATSATSRRRLPPNARVRRRARLHRAGRRGRRRADERGAARRLRRGARRARAAGRRSAAASASIPTVSSTAARRRRGATRVLRAVLREHGAHARRARLDRLPHGPRPARPRREDLRRRATTPADARARAGVVGRRRHVVPRRLVDVGAADRRQLQRRVRRMPAARRTPASRSSTARCRSPTCCSALRADQWLHNHPDAPAAQRAAIKRAGARRVLRRRRRLEGAWSTRRRAPPR